jgi:hypothetical protein
LDEGEVIRGKLVVARRDPTALLDPIEEPLDPVAGAVEIRAEADRIAAIAFWRDVGPCAFLYGKLSDPVPVVPSVGKQHRSGLETSQKFTSKPIVVGLTRRQRQPNRKAVGFHDRMNLLVNPPRDRPIDCRWFLRCMLMYADNGSVASSGQGERQVRL